MTKYYRKKPVTIRATQWQKHGDHPEVKQGPMLIKVQLGSLAGTQEHHIAHENGWIDTPENAHEVTPGDFIIQGVRGEFYACKPDIFLMTYEEVEFVDAEYVQSQP